MEKLNHNAVTSLNEVSDSELDTILGESGSGKTSLLNVLLGVYKYQGDIYYGIKDFRKKLGVVTQNMN